MLSMVGPVYFQVVVSTNDSPPEWFHFCNFDITGVYLTLRSPESLGASGGCHWDKITALPSAIAGAVGPSIQFNKAACHSFAGSQRFSSVGTAVHPWRWGRDMDQQITYQQGANLQSFILIQKNQTSLPQRHFNHQKWLKPILPILGINKKPHLSNA